MLVDAERQPTSEQLSAKVGGTSWPVSGLAGIVGGILLAASAVISAPLTSGQTVLGFGREILWVNPVGYVLVWLSLHRLHRLHHLSGEWSERWGYRIAALALLVPLINALIWGVDHSARPGGAVLLSFLGAFVLRLGLVLFAVGVYRAKRLPGWARLVLAGAVTALTLALPAAMTRIENLSTLLGVSGWLGWAIVSGAVLRHRELDADLEPGRMTVSLRDIGGAFVSKATIVSAIVSVGVLTLEWEWYVGALVVLLLYAHELGHVIAAFVRGVAVHRAPFFVPGLGAFVQTAPGASHWDDVWVSLGGPLIGGACALGVKTAGVTQGNAALAQAGDVGLWLNLFNLAPFSPLDGGRIAARTGWFGLGMTLVLGIFLLTQGLSFILLLLVLFGTWQAFAAVRTLRVGVGTQIGILGVYLGSVILLLLAAIGSGNAAWLEAPRPDWMPGLSEVFGFMFWYFVAGTFAVPFAMADERGALTRYGLLSVFGWTRFMLDGRHWIVPVHVALFAESLGLGGLRWVERSIERLARTGDPRAGEATVLAFDCIRRLGRDAEQWLQQMTPVLLAGGSLVLGEASQGLRQLGYAPAAFALQEQIE